MQHFKYIVGFEKIKIYTKVKAALRYTMLVWFLPKKNKKIKGKTRKTAFSYLEYSNSKISTPLTNITAKE